MNRNRLIAAVQRCFNCVHWKPRDVNDPSGMCEAPKPERVPFWMRTLGGPTATGHDAGKTCEAYTHGKHKPHPLDGAEVKLAVLNIGDTFGMRLYREGSGATNRQQAEVVGRGKNHLIVQFLNARYHVRVHAAQRHRAGTVIGMEHWGFDPAAEVIRGGRPLNSLADAAERLAKARRGQRIPLLGYPPFDHQTRVAFVVDVRKDELVVRVGNAGKRLYMARTGALAGIILNDPLWVLDTREAA